MKHVKRIVVLPDWQVPLDNSDLVRRVAHFVWDYKPDELAHVGDITDSTELGRWVKGMRAEYVYGGLEGGFSKTREHLAYYRRKYDGPWNIVRANHEDRLENEIERRIPGLAGLTIGGKVLNVENALRLDDYGVTYHHKPYQLAPGWLLCHGDEGSISSIPGNTALGLARALGENVVCGHTHRAGLAWSQVGNITTGHRELVGMEVGHFMDIRQAEYLKHARKNNWGSAFGILRVAQPGEKKKQVVYPELVPIRVDGSFVVEGVVYR